MRQCIATAIVLLSMGAPVARAAQHEVRVPLHDGRVKLFDLSVALAPLNLMSMTVDGEVDLRSLRGSLLVAGINQALGDGCHLDVTDEAAIIRYDIDKLPRDADATRAAARTFTAVVAPEATAAQNRTFGLLLPAQVHPDKSMVVLVHGLDSDRTKWNAMADLLNAEGYQVGWFSYPSDQPIADSAALFRKHFEAMRSTFPSMHVDLLAHSMGSLVTRSYVEGDAYAGGVDHLILIGPPNHGSRWAKYRLFLEIDEHIDLWRHQPEWSPTWMITDGLGEAGRDLRPTSAFIETLNARPRRAGVKYTIVAGDRHPAWRATGNAVSAIAHVVPDRAERWWGFRQTVHGLDRLSARMKNRTSQSDGPVSIASTHLEGVDDEIVLHADHNALFQLFDGGKPAAWDVIRDRLEK